MVQPPPPPGGSPLQVLHSTRVSPRIWGMELESSCMGGQSTTSETGPCPLDYSSIWTNYTESNTAFAIFGSRFLLLIHIESTK